MHIFMALGGLIFNHDYKRWNHQFSFLDEKILGSILRPHAYAWGLKIGKKFLKDFQKAAKLHKNIQIRH